MMTYQIEWFSRVIGLLTVALGVLCAVSLSAIPARAFTAQKEKAGPSGRRVLVKPTDAGAISPGINNCRGCHTGADKGNAPGYVTRFKSNEFVLLNEATTWDQKDVHSIAYANLSGPLGQKMEKLLKYKVAEAPQCLTCHSVDLHPDTPLKGKSLDDFATAEAGVNCTVCHGLGRNWQFDHYEEPTKKGAPLPWRMKDPRDKFNRGMADLRNPVVKARLCVSCHVGCAEEGKVVTHEMYAAGHPPLPPFELATFMGSEPKHWGYPTDESLIYFTNLAKESADKTWPLFHYHPAVAEAYLARHLATGAIATLDAELRLLEADAASANNPTPSTGVDFARFDCYACHHDLKYPSDRQKRGYEGPPGRPPLKAWIGVLAGIVAEHLAGLEDPKLKALAASFGPKWLAVRKAALARPYGDPAELQRTTADMSAWCDEFLQEMNTTTTPIYTPKQAARLVDMVAKTAGNPKWTADPEAAMQLTWAFITLRSDLQRPVAPSQLADLDKIIAVRVRYPENYTDKATNKPLPIESYLTQRMQKFAGHNAEAFHRAFLGISGMPKE
jgi:hypothetical protein